MTKISRQKNEIFLTRGVKKKKNFMTKKNLIFMTPSLQKRSLLTPRATRKCFQVKIMTKIYRQKKRNFLKPRGQEKKIFMTKKKINFHDP